MLQIERKQPGSRRSSFRSQARPRRARRSHSRDHGGRRCCRRRSRWHTGCLLRTQGLPFRASPCACEACTEKKRGGGREGGSERANEARPCTQPHAGARENSSGFVRPPWPQVKRSLLTWICRTAPVCGRSHRSSKDSTGLSLNRKCKHARVRQNAEGEGVPTNF